MFFIEYTKVFTSFLYFFLQSFNSSDSLKCSLFCEKYSNTIKIIKNKNILYIIIT